MPFYPSYPRDTVYRRRRSSRPRRERPIVNFSRAEVLQAAAQMIEAHGWVSAAAATESGAVATKARVAAMFNAAGALKSPLRATAAQQATAAAALAWAAQQSGSEYAAKIAELAEEESTTLTNRELGVAVSIVGCYLRSIATAEARAAEATERATRAATATHLGTVGARGEFVLTLAAIRQSRTGMTIMVFQSGNGGEVTYFGDSLLGCRVGTTYRIRCTVKRHGDWRGLPTTTVNRPQILAEVIVDAA